MIPVSINGQWTLLLPEHRNQQWANPWEAERIDSMHANLKPGMLVYDIGSEEGDMPALWASWGCDVVVCEPNSKVWPNIRACFEANELEHHGWFVGFSGEVEATPEGTEEWQSTARPWPSCAYGDIITNHGFPTLVERPDIPSTTIDAMAKKFGRPQAITMDIEGAELHALQGAPEVLGFDRPLLWISVHPTFMADTYRKNVMMVWELLRKYGYKWRLLTYDHELHCFAWHPDQHEPVLPE